MKNFRLSPSLVAMAAVAAIALFFWARLTDARMQRELAELEHRQADRTRLQKDNKDLAAAVSKLTALREQAPPLSRRVSKPPPPLPAGFKSVGELKNVGSATTADAFETYLWALDRGETDTLVNTLVLSDNARTEIEATFAKLPPAEREKYGSAEVMFALLYAVGDPKALTAMQSVDESPVAPNQVVLNTNWQFPGGQIREHPIPLYHAADGWKVIVSDLKVDSIIQTELDPEATAPAPAP